MFALRPVCASPFVSAGDTVLRHDIQLLADAGVIKGPISTWPLAWGPIAADVQAFDKTDGVTRDVIDAIARVRARAGWEMRSDEMYFQASGSVAEKPKRIRSFENTPRGRAEFSAGLTYTADWFTASLNGQIVDADDGDEDFRADGSVVGAVLGNFSFTLNTLDRWWGPGWDGSLILSNNARPMPAISIDRNYTDPFSNKWLRWLGPWDFSLHFAQMESDRFVPDAQFFGLRVNFKPMPSLEIGLSRTAQWCGEGRPCNSDAFVDLLLGRDNQGDDDIDETNEPGNQLAGFDLRWSTRIFDIPIAVYGQFIGEDEAGGLPSRYLGQIGVEGTGIFREHWAYRWFGEYADTKCRFYESDTFFNCAYNNGIYQTGYRYRGRTIGHNTDNDSRVVSAGVTFVSDQEHEWSATLRVGELNRGGSPDSRNSLTATGQDILSIDIRHSRVYSFGELTAGLGYESIDMIAESTSGDDVRAFLQWRTAY